MLGGFSSLLEVRSLDVLFHDSDCLVEPLGIGAEALEFHGGEPLAGVLYWLPQWLEVACSHQHGEEVQGPAEYGGGFVCANASGPVRCLL